MRYFIIAFMFATALASDEDLSLLQTRAELSATVTCTCTNPYGYMGGSMAHYAGLPFGARYTCSDGTTSDCSSVDGDASGMCTSISEFPKGDLSQVCQPTMRCGRDSADAKGKCGAPCPSGTKADCPSGEFCHAGLPIEPCAAIETTSTTTTTLSPGSCKCTNPNGFMDGSLAHYAGLPFGARYTCADGTTSDCSSVDGDADGMCTSTSEFPKSDLSKICQPTMRCGRDSADAKGKCGAPCPSGTKADCPSGEFCHAGLPIEPCKAIETTSTTTAPAGGGEGGDTPLRCSLGPRNTNGDCPAGSNPIASAADCEACKDGLGGIDVDDYGVGYKAEDIWWASSGNWGGDTKGCYLNTQANSLYFNTAATGAPSPYMRPVCGGGAIPPSLQTPAPTPAKVCRSSCHRGDYIKKKSCQRDQCAGCCECTGECEPKRKPPREKKCKEKCYRKRGEKDMKKHMCYKNKCAACPECMNPSLLEADEHNEEADEDDADDDVDDDVDDDDADIA